MFVIETLSKPPWQQQQKHGQTKDSMGTQIAHYVCFIIVFIFHLFSETKQHKSLKFAWGENGTSDGLELWWEIIYLTLFRTKPCSLLLWQRWCLALLERVITSTIHLVDIFVSLPSWLLKIPNDFCGLTLLCLQITSKHNHPLFMVNSPF